MTRGRNVFLSGCGLAVVAALVTASFAPTGAFGNRGIPAAAQPISVVVVVFDEFPLASMISPDGQIDEGLFPHFSKLAGTSTWFRNTTSVAGFTSRALPAILTGRYPTRSLLTVGGTAGANLFTLLSPSHHVRSPDTFPGLCPRAECGGVRGKEKVHPSLDAFAKGPRGEGLDPFLGMLEQTGPCLCVYHPVVPHSPWRYLPSGQRYGGTNPIPGQVEMSGPGRAWGDDEWLVQQAYQRHLLQAAFADRLLGRIVGHMKRVGTFDDTVLVVTADHGVAFRAGQPKRDVTDQNAGDVVAVPLFIKAPGQIEGALSDVPAELVDVVPSLMDLLGVKGLDPILDGVSLFSGGLPQERERKVKPVEVSPTGAWQQALHRKVEVFGGEDSPAIFGISPTGTQRFLGAPLVDAVMSSLSVEVPNLASYETARRADPDLPALLQGKLVGDLDDQDRDVAIAVDGRVVAITRSYATSEGQRFYVMLPPRIFKDEDRSFSFFDVSEDVPLMLPITDTSSS